MSPLLENVLRNVPWVILILPLGGFVALSLFGEWIKRDKEEDGAAILACVTVIASFALSVWVVASLLQWNPVSGLRYYVPALGKSEGLAGPPQAHPDDWDWLRAGPLSVPFSLLLDPLSAVMILTVTGVGSLIHIYSLGYMAHDEERVRYFSYLNLFTFFMLLLVLGGSLPLLFVGWEGVGLCSYLLIGFWFKKKSASNAGMKAFIVNRIGDAGLILGTILAFHTLGTVDLLAIKNVLTTVPAEGLWQFGPLTAIALLLFLGATGKSAQLPLHVWLPDAMEGPTPVSALIHAATMVTAGVYMVARLSPVYTRSSTALLVVALVGAITALMAATIALVQNDIKKVLAYSTVSQLGYMFLACGVGAFGVGVFHLFTHAFFKALLFLGSGSVIHALSGEQDMRRMGGLRSKIPWTFLTFVAGTAAIAGIPFFAGFFSKDEILAAALDIGGPWLFGVAVLTAALTAFYMCRLLFMTFFGEFRGGHEAEHHIHESPMTMLGPLAALALGCLVVGYVPIPAFLAPVFHEGLIGSSLVSSAEQHGGHVGVEIAALGAAAIGIVVALYLYVLRKDLPERVAHAFRLFYRLFDAKYFLDDLYNWFARRVVVDGSRVLLWKGLDVGIIDGAVNGVASATAGASRAIRGLETGLVRTYAVVILGGAVGVLALILWVG